MKRPGQWMRRFANDCVVLALVPLLSLPAVVNAQEQQAPADPQATPATPAPPATGPVSPASGATPDAQSGAAPAAPAEPILPVRDGTQPTPDTQTPAKSQSVPKPPVGTAAAPYEKGIGTAASRPAGAVIAPAKQRRTRTLLIKVGVVVAAAVAVGTVVALSSASPSTPH